MDDDDDDDADDDIVHHTQPVFRQFTRSFIELNFIIDRVFEDGSITGAWALKDLTPTPRNIIHPFRRSFQHIYFIFYGMVYNL